jgi:HEAT repeat protein
MSESAEFPRAAARAVAIALLVLLAAVGLAPRSEAQMPPPSKVDQWISPHNQKRIKIQWEGVPEYKGKKQPDGSTEPPKAPFPFLLCVKEAETREAKKLDEVVFADARVSLSSALVKFVQITPAKALDLPYLKSASGIKDPCLVAVDRDFKVVGIVNAWKDFDEKTTLALLQKTSDAAYPVKLGAFVAEMFKIMQAAEKTWAEEKRVADLMKRAGSADPAKQKALDEECDKISKEVASTNAELEKRETDLRETLKPKEAAPEAAPTTFGTGRSKRKLTPQELEAIESYKEFAKNENPIVRAAAVEDLGAIDSGAMVEFILGACNDVDERVIEAAGKALGKMTSDESLTALVAGLENGNPKARAAATFGFAHVKRAFPAAIPRIVGVLHGGDDLQRLAAMQALANMKDPATVDALVDGLNDKIPALRVIAANALGELKSAKAVPKLCDQLAAEDWPLQKAATEALAKIRSRDSIDPLLAKFETEKGTLAEVLYKALIEVTGQDFSNEPKFWRRWWDQAKERFQLPSDEEIAKARVRAEKNNTGYKVAGAKNYHTITTLSKKLIFVIDVSGSMADSITIPDSATKEQLEAFGSRVKIEIAKKELIALLGSLENDVEFNIITFAGFAKPWQEGLVGAGMRTSAIKFVDKLQAIKPSTGGRGPSTGGGDEIKTNTYGAMLAAFGFADNGQVDWKKRGKVDTIFVVTDGLPTTGDIVDVPKMIDAVTDMNRTRGLTIHLVVFDTVTADRLRGLAEKNGGKCVVRGLDNAPPK